MRIEVCSDQKYSQYDQFDPLQLKQVKLFHVECSGGSIRSSTVDQGHQAQFECGSCGDRESQYVVPCRAALRRVLIGGEAQKVGSIEFLRGGSNSKNQSTI